MEESFKSERAPHITPQLFLSSSVLCLTLSLPFLLQYLFFKSRVFGSSSLPPSLQEELLESSDDEDDSTRSDEKQSGSVIDLEDLGSIMTSVKKAKVRHHAPAQ